MEVQSDQHVGAGASQHERTKMGAHLRRLDEGAPAIADVSAEMTAAERVGLYGSASHLMITTRIVVVDLLTGRLKPSQVAGLLVLNAHRATEQSGEGFAVRLLRSSNRAAFVRGLSDEPGLVGKGLCSLERVMRALHVKHVFLWPRFQSTVQELSLIHI